MTTSSVEKRQVATSPASTKSQNRPATTDATKEVVSPFRNIIDLLLCTASIYFCYLIYGILHEKITRQPYGEGVEKEKFTHTLFLTTIQCFGNALWALLLVFLEAFRRQKVHNSSESVVSKALSIIFDSVPKSKYALVSFSYFAAMASSTAALKFVSYPIQALAKSSKLIPVMVGRILRGHKYSLREYFHVALITGGIAVFFLFEGKGSAQTSSILGFALLAVSLIMDAVTGPTQEQISHVYNPTVQGMTLWVNIFPCVIMGALIAVTGELSAAVEFCQRHPSLVWELAVYCLMSAIGQSVIVWALFRFNSMTVTIITTTRKFFTILASVLWFQNTLALMQWVGVAFVFLGIGADSQLKFTRSRKIHHEIVKEALEERRHKGD